MSTPIDYMDKIDKLLRKASGTDSEAEAEAFRDKAYTMMADRDIKLADIEARRRNGTERPADEPIVEKTMKITGIFRYGLQDLSFAVVHALENVGVRAFWRDKTWAAVPRKSGPEGSTRLVDAVDFIVVGRESDVDTTIMLLISLQLQAAAAMTLWWKDNPDKDWMGRGLSFRSRREFIMSFGHGAAQKIRLAQRRARATVATGSGAELVLRSKNAEVDAYFAAKGLKASKSRLQRGTFDSIDSGFTAGQQANTGDTGIGKTDRRRLT